MAPVFLSTLNFIKSSKTDLIHASPASGNWFNILSVTCFITLLSFKAAWTYSSVVPNFNWLVPGAPSKENTSSNFLPSKKFFLFSNVTILLVILSIRSALFLTLDTKSGDTVPKRSSTDLYWVRNCLYESMLSKLVFLFSDLLIILSNIACSILEIAFVSPSNTLMKSSIAPTFSVWKNASAIFSSLNWKPLNPFFLASTIAPVSNLLM